ncbi:pilus assembly protein FimV [Shewanella sp. 3B26]|uniref:Pilus assembly protein FimV n=1 Tax=Shewanella zhuhaiensis TaxID=2919576 RepID=A0AAJ1F037_9GAMM|nr:FimV/HubP family polar landmark protein [Shewanella zhuhaiensis]MCH4294003.1 pilus assembly protein FimV [Shewanella zhuhaiensis]
MNFRTSYLAGILASLMAVAAIPLFSEVEAAEPLKITGPDGQSREANQRQYGPTTPQDTFWSIAQKVRPDSSVSVYQVMAAIYDANPHAFSGANYNTLEKGMILLIPSREVMLSIPKSMAQQRAESQDKAWRTGKVETKPATKPAAVKTDTPKTETVKAEPPKAEPAPVTVPQIDPKLVEENQALSSEISRLTEALGVRNNDIEALTAQVNQLTEEVQGLNESLAQLKEQNEQLKAENKELKQAQALAEVEANKPDDMWRNLMDNPLLLVLGAVIPALLVLLLVWMFLRRRSKGDAPATMTETAVATAATAAVATAATAAVMADEPSADEMAVHLDSGDEDESLDALLDLDNVDLKPEAELEGEDLVVESAESDDFADDGQSLDDLWAEAMGEQSDIEDVMSTDPADLMAELEMPAETADSEDLDALMGELDADIAAKDASSDDDLDALMAGFDSPEPEAEAEASTETQAEDDLDALMAGFDMAEESAEESAEAAVPAEPEIDADAIAAELEAELGADAATVDAEEDLDALLAGFDAPAETETVTEAAKDDLSDAIAAELDTELDAEADTEEDLDALLAGFDAPAETEIATEAAENDLSDAIAAELDAELDAEAETEEDLDALLAGFDAPAQTETTSETVAEDDLSDAIAAELDAELDAETEDDLDALLASFDAPAEAAAATVPDTGSETGTDDLSDAIASELDLDSELDTGSAEAEEDTDLDALLASFDAPDEVAGTDEDIAAGLGDELPLSDADDDLDSLLAGFESDTNDIAGDIAADDADDGLSAADVALAGAALAGAGAAVAKSDKSDSKAPLEFSSSAPKDPVAVSARDSGFFDDLKANKGSNVLEWEPSKPDADATVDVSDDDLLSAFAAQGDDGDDEFMLDVDEQHSMTVDEALAALDASEKSKRQAKVVMDNDLSSFQKENGFIDIDKLLNDADDSEPEPYRELDMDIGEVNSLIGDTAMVDVDDEENSVNAKLDLARAYIEIDDKDSARALLKEVEMDGNDRQKAEAAELLGEIG